MRLCERCGADISQYVKTGPGRPRNYCPKEANPRCFVDRQNDRARESRNWRDLDGTPARLDAACLWFRGRKADALRIADNLAEVGRRRATGPDMELLHDVAREHARLIRGACPAIFADDGTVLLVARELVDRKRESDSTEPVSIDERSKASCPACGTEVEPEDLTPFNGISAVSHTCPTCKPVALEPQTWIDPQGREVVVAAYVLELAQQSGLSPDEMADGDLLPAEDHVLELEALVTCARLVDVPARDILRAKRIKEAAPDLQEAILAGELDLDEAEMEIESRKLRAAA